MRSAGISYDDAAPPRTVLDDTLESAVTLEQAQLGLQSIRDYIPPWLGGGNSRSQPLSRMLKALKIAAESYLETSVSTAEVVFPFPISDSYRDTILRSAYSSVSLHPPWFRLAPAGIFAAKAYGIGGNCEDDPEQLILTVDYSRAALTALLVDEECSVFLDRRVLHDTRLGLDGLHDRSEASRSDLERALREITKLPLEDGNGAGLKRINNLVLLGESAGNSQLHDVLKEVLAEQYIPLVTTASENSKSAIDPLFAASRGVALHCWERVNEDEGHGCPI